MAFKLEIVLLIASVSMTRKGVHGTICFECKDTPAPRICSTITTCSQGQVCFVDSFVTSGGLVLFNSGCRSKQRCGLSGPSNLIGKRDTTGGGHLRNFNLARGFKGHDVRKRSDITLCEECCSTNFCNNQGCNSGPNGKSTHCYSCDYTLDPKQCNHVATCAAEEFCGIDIHPAFRTSADVIYTQGCFSQQRCHSVSTQKSCAQKCCDTDYCNEHCNVTISTSSPATVMTSRHSTAPSMTKTITASTKVFSVTASVTHTSSLTSPLIHMSRTTDHVPSHHASMSTRTSGASATTSPPPSTSPWYNPLLEKKCMQHLNNGYFYDSYSNLCFKLVKSSRQLDKRQAETLCRVDGATLIAVRNNRQQDMLLSWLFSHQMNDTDFWIGASTHVTGSNQYFWPAGDAVAYNRWGRSFPTPQSQVHHQDCVILYNKDRYFWHDVSCSSRMTGFICEQWHRSANETEQACRNISYNGYFYFKPDDFCVRIVDSRGRGTYTWAEAYHECYKDGASLVTIDTAAKTNLILQWIFSQHENATDFWIGAFDKYRNDTFYWPHGEPLSYTHWGAPGLSHPHPAVPTIHTQPDEQYGSRDQRCVYINYRQNFTWFDRNCQQPLSGYICQFFGTGEECQNRLFDGYFHDSTTNMCISIVTGVNVTRPQALAHCVKEGSALVVIDSQDKMDYVLALIFFKKANDTDFWTGGLDVYSNGRFYWQHIGQKFTYTNWYRNTAVTPQTLDCAYMDHTDQYHWTPTSCLTQLHGYSCQIDGRSI